MSRTSGSEQRQRHHDVRIRLRDKDELDQFDQLVADAGFHGQHARGDWIRSHLPGIVVRPTPPAAPPVVHPWLNTIAAIDGLANELGGLHPLLTRLETGELRFADADRLLSTFPSTITRLLGKADEAIGAMRARIDKQ